MDTSRVVIDLAASDGVKPGTVVSLRRDKIPIVHPVTGELLGELDEEVATGRVIEVRDKFSVVEVQNVAAGDGDQGQGPGRSPVTRPRPLRRQAAHRRSRLS